MIASPEIAEPEQPFDPLAFWAATCSAGRQCDAEASLQETIDASGELAMAARYLLAVGLTCMGRAGEAVQHARARSQAVPDNAQAAVSLAGYKLAAAQWDAEAWNGFERRHDLPSWRTAAMPAWLRWCAGAVPSNLIIHCPDGDGDAIMMARYVRVLADQGCRVSLAVDARLIPLMACVEGLTAILDNAAPLPQDVAWVDRLSLPGLMRTTPETIPGAGGYLTVNVRRAGLWRYMGTTPSGLRVGLCWASASHHATPAWRSLPLNALRTILNVPGVAFVNLQVGPRNGDGDVLGIPSNHAGTLRDYSRTAGLISTLDLVISVDTSVAHLAGALGRPVWIMLPTPADWRWLEGRLDTPWYTCARLFRQGAQGAWSTVAEDVAEALGAWRSLQDA